MPTKPNTVSRLGEWEMTFMIMIPADLDRLVIFFRHLLEIVKKSYPTVNVAEINTPEDKDNG